MDFFKSKTTKFVAVLLVFNFFVVSMPLGVMAAQNNIATVNLQQNNEKVIPEKFFSSDNKLALKKKAYNPTNYASDAIVAAYMIPGLGEVALLTTNAVMFGGAVYYAKSSIYQKVQRYLAEVDYEDEKINGEPTANHTVEQGRNLPTRGEPNSSKDLEDSNGIKQKRYYDKNGNADVDIDYRHSEEETHIFPHKHIWKYGSRGNWQPM